MRLANAEVLPFQFGGLAETVSGYLDELKALLTTRRDEALERNRQLDEDLFTATADPREPTRPPARAEVPPYLNFAPLDNAVAGLKQAAERYEATLGKARLTGRLLAEANQALLRIEPALTSPDGLPRRSWYRHQLYAPGFYTGYGVKTIPAVREAIEQGYWREAEDAIVRVAERLTAAAALIDRAGAALGTEH